MNSERTPVIVSACRTPIGEYMKSLATFSAASLGAIVVKEAVLRAGIDPDTVDEVIMGNVVPSGGGQAPARQAAIHGGIPATKAAMTINKVCGSGLKAVQLAAQGIMLGDVDCVIAGGMESMSNVPYYLMKARGGYRMGNGQVVDGMIHDGLWDSFNDYHMGVAAERTAEKSDVTREAQDRFAMESHQKAAKATESGAFREEIVPVEIPQRKGDPLKFENDERIRPETTMESLAKLRPAFKKGGTVTAGNAPGLNDGASALMIMSAAKAKELGVTPLAKVTGYAVGGAEPEDVFFAPIVAVRKLLARAGTKISDYDLMEVNEAFAAQVLADGKELGWDWDRVNVNGGAVALGHPIGASGARILTTLLYAMKNRQKRTGMAAICLGGGNAVALSVEALNLS
ncbi:MAG: acetyl-CoA C-acetyltransferase [Gemmatimonadetes bacterium]|nr:acetyl-CoA C-acetyltransferase [Gemmatimonadota bacterium]